MFRDNSTLIRTAERQDVTATAPGDPTRNDTYQAGDGANAFVIEAGNVGDDTFLGWGADDSLINNQAIFDGNGDGFIQFGGNGVLDIDRTGRRTPGNDQLQLAGVNAAITELRYLGNKDGGFVYADSATLKNLWTPFGAANVLEGDVTDDTFDLSGGARVLLHDNGLGLNLGGDIITGFGDDDLLVTTSQLYDATGNGIVTFGRNDVLDTSGAGGPDATDPSQGPGGQLDFNSPDALSVTYLGSNQINGVTYYYYGTAGSTFDPSPEA